MSIYKGDKKVAGLGATRRNIGELVSSILPLTDAGLHLLDGAVISGNGIYGKFVTYIAGLVSSYPGLFVSESDWQSSVNTYGVCGKFVYDSANNTVRLPKITGMIEGTTDLSALGSLVEAGLPNITGEVKNEANHGLMNTNDVNNVSGAFFIGTRQSARIAFAGDANGFSIGFNASLSNPIYGKSNTVQPQTIKAYYYICVAASVKPNIEADMDQIATELNGKANKDLSNINPASGMLKNWLNTENVRVVIETYSNGTSWYRIYNDGWIEQGGYSSSANITFLKQMANTNYTISIGNYRNGGATSGDFRYVTGFSKTGFTKALDSSDSFWWRVEGLKAA